MWNTSKIRLKNTYKLLHKNHLYGFLDEEVISTVLSGAKNCAELEDALNASGIQGFTDDEHAQLNALHARDFSGA